MPSGRALHHTASLPRQLSRGPAEDLSRPAWIARVAACWIGVLRALLAHGVVFRIGRRWCVVVRRLRTSPWLGLCAGGRVERKRATNDQRDHQWRAHAGGSARRAMAEKVKPASSEPVSFSVEPGRLWQLPLDSVEDITPVVVFVGSAGRKAGAHQNRQRHKGGG